jgi:hypothetical protein
MFGGEAAPRLTGLTRDDRIPPVRARIGNPQTDRPRQTAHMKPRLGLRALPDFLIIGAQKSATTSLLYYMRGHPQIRPGWNKAAHYFDLNYHHGLRWYARRFPYLSPLGPLANLAPPSGERSWITGESSPSYMFLPEVPARVHEVLPDVKIIAILRDPVDRLISQYHHEARKGRAPASFEEFVAPSIDTDWPPEGEIEALRQRCAVPRGFYEDQIRHWRTFFPAERFCVLGFEDLVQDPQGTLNETFAFLGVGPHAVDTSKVLNRGTRKPGSGIDSGLLDRLTALYRERNAGLSELIGKRFAWCP